MRLQPKEAKCIAVMIGFAIAGTLVSATACSEEKSSPDASPPRAPSVETHSKGTTTFRLEGVHIPPPEPGDGALAVYRNIDLDRGVEAPANGSDVWLEVYAREVTAAYTAERAVNLGASQVNYASCETALSNSSGRVRVGRARPPTDYICLETNEGRTSVFRISNLRRYRQHGGEPFFFNIIVQFEYTTWKRQ